ncbi:MAG TPA: hypothetical protein PKD09_16210 [Aggregatilinea sp.]|jgi:hypothetical protein|uniref:hypothetical protein n=1 Tax=Aggregatilinea sp. TaxID=2806333 RepID=UPI002BE1F06E|nr:hypothetical protein [Aggregatilinea sp.]HML23199.1 hypothetical protein [Aggregatilinea sp.]
MLNSWRMKANHRLMTWIGVLGVGLMPCPDCGLPLGVKIWPVAALIWGFQRVVRRNVTRMDLLLSEDLAERAEHAHAGCDHEHAQAEAGD